MVVGEGFNEAVSRAGITGLVDTADTIGTSIIGELAAVALDDAEAKHYTERAKMKPGIRDGLIINGVEVARIENTNVPPHLALIVLGGGWVTQLGLIAKELRQMRKERNAAPKEDEQ